MAFGRKKRGAAKAPRDEQERAAGRAQRRARESIAAAAEKELSTDPADATGDGPWDAEQAPQDDLARVDLGSLHVPTLDGVELRLEAAPTGEVVAVVLVDGPSAAQVGVFAAPKSEGIWRDVRAEIVEQLKLEGGEGRQTDGTFGTEILASVAGPEGPSQVRFVGIDGPRWFLRALVTGPAATEQVAAALLERAVRSIVVHRGGEAMPVRDPLPLQLPEEAMQAAAEGQAAEDGQVDGVGQADGGGQADEQGRLAPGMPERGPETTETR